jgi:hypothetical protein
VTVKNAVFWDVTPCGSCQSRYLGGIYHLHQHSGKNQRARNHGSSNQQLKHTDVSEECTASIIRVEIISELGTTYAVTSVVSISLIVSTLTIEATIFSETSSLTRSTWHHIPEDGLPQN